MQARKVLIVGGGSAGWMAAAYLNAALNRQGQRIADISLIESPDIPRISVGEATVPSIRHLLSVIGIDEIEFMKATNATFKQSIKYVNWLRGDGDAYHHPFSRNRVYPLDFTGVNWLQSDRSIPFMETASVQPAICEMGLAPQMLGKWDFGHPLSYAYHMNAQKFADYLRDWSTARGVTHILDNVTHVDVGENGHIAGVDTKSGKQLEADLFIDCTGFAAILIEKALGVGFEDASQWLLCDRAITKHIPYENYYWGNVRPYTTATALSSGWVWDIPLSNLRSVGYLHSSQYISEDEAMRELHAYEPHAKDFDARVIRFKVGRRKQAWAGNCVAIGLAGGFIEPLESTGLYLSDLAAVMLAEHFPRGEDWAPLAMRFNRIMSNRFYEVLDFINMHYCLTRRTDTDFWKEVSKPERINPRLHAKLDYWRIKPPSPSDFEDQFLPGFPGAAQAAGSHGGDSRPAVDTAALWNHESYECILYGMDFMGEEYRKELGEPRPPAVVPEHVASRVDAAPYKLPTHEDWLRKKVGMASYQGPTDPGTIWG